MNCRKDKPPEEVASVPWPVHFGWLFLSGSLVREVCRDCKASVTVVGLGIFGFFTCAAALALVYALT